METSWRSTRNILVPHVSAIGMIGVARAIGSSGYTVHVCSDDPMATGLRSRFAASACVCPPYDSSDYLPWLRDYVVSSDIHAIVPSEGMIVAIRDHFDDFRHLLPVPSSWETVLTCFSKAEYFDLFLKSADMKLTEKIPPTLVCRRDTDLPSEEALRELGSPVFVKTDAVVGETRQGSVRKCSDSASATEQILQSLESHPCVLVQGAVAGCKATCNLFLDADANVVAESMCIALHEMPHDGGLTVLRKTWWHQGIRDDALLRLRAMNWSGVAMMEYKFDAHTGEWHFIEANTRYWSALHLDLFAGTDFPTLQLDSFFEKCEQNEPTPQRLGVIARHTVPGEVGYVVTMFRDPAVGWSHRMGALVEFFLLFLNPAIKADLLYKGDRFLYWYQWWKYFRDLGK